MPDLSFEVIGAEARPHAAVPTLIFKLRIDNADEVERIHSVLLRSQIQISVNRRRYTPEAQAQLLEVFGEPSRWGEDAAPSIVDHIRTLRFRSSRAVLLSICPLCVPMTLRLSASNTSVR